MTVFHWLSQIILVHDTPPHAFYIIPDILTVNRITTAHIFALHSKYRFVYIWNELCANGDIQSSFLTIWEHYRNRWIIALMNCVHTIPGYSLEVLVCILTKPFSYLHLLIVFLSAYIAYIAYEFPKEYHVTKVSENWCTTWHKWYAKYVCMIASEWVGVHVIEFTLAHCRKTRGNELLIWNVCSHVCMATKVEESSILPH